MIMEQRPVECKYCGKFYLQPCNEEREKTCQNIKLKGRKEAA